MTIIQLPSANIRRQWSPAEILAIEDPLDTGRIQKVRAGKAAAVAIAKRAPGRAKKKILVKAEIVEILRIGENQTIRGLAERIGNISTNTVSQYLKELEADGLIYKEGFLWVNAE